MQYLGIISSNFRPAGLSWNQNCLCLLALRRKVHKLIGRILNPQLMCQVIPFREDQVVAKLVNMQYLYL